MRTLNACGSLLLVAGVGLAQSVAHNDLNQTSANTAESRLTPSNVTAGKFGQLGSYAVDGQVYAQPLYVPGVTISSVSYDVLIVATLANSVYAFDANMPGSAPLWHINFGTGYSQGANIVFYNATTGIVGTPVIDAANSLLYVVWETATPSFVLAKLNLTTGATVASATITGAYPGSGDVGQSDPTSGGNVLFNPVREWQRPGLVMANSKVYVAFGGAGDARPWHGWLFAYNTADLSQAAVFCTTPSSYGGPVWQSGRAPAVDASGNIYVATGNNNSNPTGTAYGESVLKFSPTLALLDWFTPSNFAALDASDSDVSSSGPLLIPGTSLMVIAAKDFNVYLIDTTCMGHLQGSSGCALQTFQTLVGGTATAFSGSYGAAFANNLLYLPITAGSIYEFAFSAGSFNTTPIATQTNTYGMPGPAQMTLSSNGTSNTILWVATGATSSFEAKATGTLHALNTSLAELWNSGATLGTLAKYTAPTVAAGRVYVPNADGAVNVFGLLPGTSIQGQVSITGQVTIH
jgi:hypothetical protein